MVSSIVDVLTLIVKILDLAVKFYFSKRASKIAEKASNMTQKTFEFKQKVLELKPKTFEFKQKVLELKPKTFEFKRENEVKFNVCNHEIRETYYNDRYNNEVYNTNDKKIEIMQNNKVLIDLGKRIGETIEFAMESFKPVISLISARIEYMKKAFSEINWPIK